MFRNLLFGFAFIVLSVLVLASEGATRTIPCIDSTQTYIAKSLSDEYDRIWRLGVHTVGDFVLSVSNSGLFGMGSAEEPDYFTGIIYEHGAEYPKFSEINHLLWANIWVGGILEGDTLVSEGFARLIINYAAYEFQPDQPPGGEIQMRSIGNPALPGFEEAVSEQDFVTTYSDTSVWWWVMDEFFGTLHKPLNIEVTQKSYAWSADYAKDFVIVDMDIKNIGEQTIKKAYFGLVVRPLVGFDLSYG